MSNTPLKAKTTIQDLLDMVHKTIIKEKGVNDVILEELQAIDEKIDNGTLENYEVNTPLYWSAIFADIKDNGYKLTQKINVGDTVMVCQTKDNYRTYDFNVEMIVVSEDENTYRVRVEGWPENESVPMPKMYCKKKENIV